MAKIAVIGAGISGIMSAYYLAKAGNDVVIYDKHKNPAYEASYANGGQISASNAEVWNSWDNVMKALKWITQRDAPFSFNPFPEPRKYLWIAQFLTHIRDADTLTYKTCKMAIKSRQLYLDIAHEENLDFELAQNGILHFYRDSATLAKAEKTNKLYNHAGLERVYVKPKEIEALEPNLNLADVLGGFYTKEDFTGDIHKFCKNLLHVMSEKYNVVYINTTINDINEVISKYNKIVISAGVNSPKLARQVGDYIPIYPVKGYSLTVTNPGKDTPNVSLLDDESKIVTSRLGPNTLRLAGTAEFNGVNYDINWKRVSPFFKWIKKNTPYVDIDQYNPWVGLRPMTPNMMPIVKQSKYNDNVYYNTGHGHLGWTLSAITAHELTEIMS